MRLSEGRMFYLVNNQRPDQAFQHCWECGKPDNSREDANCGECSADLRGRRFQRDGYDETLRPDVQRDVDGARRAVVIDDDC